MTTRINYAAVAPEALRAVYGVERYVEQSGLDHTLLALVKLRASYMNGCAYCVDMHTKDARVAGETGDGGVPYTVYEETRPHFTEAELVNLTMAVIAINMWNRLAVTFHADVGSHQPKHALSGVG
jgi:AhpD family alkylhydroperoxidase